jgi:TldD protein
MCEPPDVALHPEAPVSIVALALTVCASSAEPGVGPPNDNSSVDARDAPVADAGAGASETRAAAGDPAPLEALLVDVLDRASASLADRPEPPHYLSLAVEDWEQVTLSVRDGTIGQRKTERVRLLDVDVRTGTPELDSSHPLRGFSSLAEADRRTVQVPLDEQFALRHAVWRALDEAYRSAAERIVVLRANRNVKVEEEDPAPDFEPRAPVVARASVPPLPEGVIDAWEPHLLAASQRLSAAPELISGGVTLQLERVRDTFVDSEGTRLVHGRTHGRLSLVLNAVAPDGDEVQVFDATDVHDPSRLDPAAVEARVDAALHQLRARLAAPRADPYSGPVLLVGRAAGVFFHEVLGHRVEGHRQKRDDEGKTFADQVGRRVLPAWIDIYDDPTIAALAGEQLNGHYAYDDEGVPAQRAPLVEDGVFVGFLMGRSPIEGFEHSNGHGRRSSGYAAQSRMGNTIVDVSAPLSSEQLRARLVEQVRQQGLEYGYIVEEIEGGFTMTGRITPNAFNVRASSTRRVFADGRPDEQVRGIDLVGTPLVAFDNLIAAGDDPQVFNGVCGAESGWVPVSAVSPSILFRRLEFQLKEKGEDRPPLLAKPTVEGDGTSSADGEVGR